MEKYTKTRHFHVRIPNINFNLLPAVAFVHRPRALYPSSFIFSYLLVFNNLFIFSSTSTTTITILTTSTTTFSDDYFNANFNNINFNINFDNKYTTYCFTLSTVTLLTSYFPSSSFLVCAALAGLRSFYPTEFFNVAAIPFFRPTFASSISILSSL